jgi:diguanylate cyclase (GGDEF)-like protein
VKPVDACALADCLDKIAAPEKHPPYRVLIVEDEPTTAALNSNILRKAGMLTQVVNDPLGFLDTLSAFLPDVILMDIYMPRCNGVQLAAVLRHQEAYVGIPIIFLSTEQDVDRQLLALRYGGDEFLTKPIQGPHLVSMVITRAQRSRATREALTHDSLTGLLNHSAFIEHTRREFSRARRRKAPCAMALIDLDHFNVINERFGLSAADGCLKDLAHILRQRLRVPDVVGRFGADEFAVLLADTDARNAFKVMDDLRASFSLLEHQGPDATFCATFSCGLADIRGTEAPLDLRMRAEHALRCAPEDGGNLAKL